MSATTPEIQKPACDLCGDQGPLLLRPKCHLTAPLAVDLDGNQLILRCYVPECSREVARFTVDRDGGPPAIDVEKVMGLVQRARHSSFLAGYERGQGAPDEAGQYNRDAEEAEQGIRAALSPKP